jgi:hypothetical protein
MPYAACDSCQRVFATGSEGDEPAACPSCLSPLRAVTAEEALRALQLPPGAAEPVGGGSAAG